MTPEQQAVIKRLRRAHSEHRGYEGMVNDYIDLADMYLAEHPSDAPPVTDEDDCIKWPEPEKRRVPNPLDDELREARRLLNRCRDVLGSLKWTKSSLASDAESFLARTAWVEQQETK